MALEQYSFGAGSLYMVPQGVAAPLPVQVGTLQDISVDMVWSEKELMGQFDAAAAIARAGLKLSGKIKSGKFKAADLASVIFGPSATPALGTTQVVNNEGGTTGKTIPAGVTLPTSASTASGSVLPFSSTTGVVVGQSVSGTNIPAGATVASLIANTSVTLSAPITGVVANAASIVFGPSFSVTNAAGFQDDLGVVNVATGVQMTRVVSAPTAGQYAVNAGNYTFSAADQAAGVTVLVSYSYTQSVAGQGFTYTKQLMGLRPTFKMVLSKPGFTNNPNYTPIMSSMIIWSAGINKFSLDNKNEDWTIPESDWSASSDFLGRVFTWGGDQ